VSSHTDHYVLGVDPGKMTGVALLKENYGTGLPFSVVLLDEIEGGVEGFIDWAEENLDDLADYVVCEKFELDGRTPKPDLTPKEIIGALKVFQRADAFFQLGHKHWALECQTNTQGKHLMTNEVLKRAGYYPKRGEVKGGHSTDALRHALTYVVKTLKHKPTLELLFPKEES